MAWLSHSSQVINTLFQITNGPFISFWASFELFVNFNTQAFEETSFFFFPTDFGSKNKLSSIVCALLHPELIRKKLGEENLG